MRPKSFHGPSLTDAMRQVREALGEDAIIVATRDDDMGGIRVTAAIDDIEPARAAPPAMRVLRRAPKLLTASPKRWRGIMCRPTSLNGCWPPRRNSRMTIPSWPWVRRLMRICNFSR